MVHSFVSVSRKVACFAIADELSPGVSELERLPVIPLSRLVAQYPPNRYAVLVAVGYLRMNRVRELVSEKIAELGYGFGSYVHPSVEVLPSVIIEDNCIVLDHVSIHPGTRIGMGSFISSGSVLGHDCGVGAYSWIGSGCALGGRVRLGRRCFLGLHAALGHGAALGEAVFVGAQTFVTGELPAGATVVAKGGKTLQIDSHRYMALSLI